MNEGKSVSLEQHGGSQRVPRSLPTPRTFLLSLSLLALGGSLLFVRAWLPRGSESAGQRSHLLSIIGAVRPFEGRLGGAQYAPYDPRHPVLVHSSDALLSSVRHIEEATEERDSAANRAAVGLTSLLAERDGSKHLRRGIAQLEESVGLDSENAVSWSDLAAAELELARRTESPQALVSALSAALHAVRADGSLPEAWFNLALIRSELGLTRTATRAWEKYLDLDPRSDWAIEARHQLEPLRQPSPFDAWEEARQRIVDSAIAGGTAQARGLVKAFAQQVRMLIDEDLLGRWGSAWGEGKREEAATALGAARVLSTALAEATGDPMDADAISAIDRALADPLGASRCAALAEGHRAYAAGAERYHAGEYEAAEDLLLTSRRALGGAGTPFAPWADFQIALIAYHRGQNPQVTRRLESLLSAPAASRHPVLRANTLWILGLTEVVQGQPMRALGNYLSALKLFSAAGELDNALAMSTFAAEAFRLMGDEQREWQRLGPALSSLPRIVTPRRRQNVLEEASAGATALGQPEAALAFLDEAVEAAEAEEARGHVDGPVMAGQAHHKRSTQLVRMGRPEEALAEIDAAQRSQARVAGDGIRAELSPDVLVATSRAQRAIDPGRALEELDRGLALYQDADYRLSLPNLYRERAQILLDLHQDDAAEADLELAIDEIEARSDSLKGADLRGSYLDSVRGTFDLGVRLEALRGRKDRALEYTERGRARALLDLVRGAQRGGQGGRRAVPSLLGTVEIQRRLPGGTLVVEYVELDDRLVTIVVGHDQVELFESELGAQEVEDLARRFRRLVASGTGAGDSAAPPAFPSPPGETRTRDSSKGAGAQLFRLLVAPWRSIASGAGRLVLVADHGLREVPFGALRDPSTGRYLIEDFELVMGQSASLYLFSSERDDTLSTSANEGGGVIVGNPAFDRSRLPWLENLPGAEREANAVGAAVGRTPLLGSDATKSAFLGEAAGAEVIYFAGHALASEKYVLESGLVLAPSPGAKADDGILTAAELYRLRLPRTRLVVLSACSTAAGSDQPAEGMESLARPFVAAGVPAVVASLWPVEDRATADLLIDFYSRYRAGENAASALRGAQLAKIHDSAPANHSTSAWAAFEVIGGAANSRPLP